MLEKYTSWWIVGIEKLLVVVKLETSLVIGFDIIVAVSILLSLISEYLGHTWNIAVEMPAFIMMPLKYIIEIASVSIGSTTYRYRLPVVLCPKYTMCLYQKKNKTCQINKMPHYNVILIICSTLDYQLIVVISCVMIVVSGQ